MWEGGESTLHDGCEDGRDDDVAQERGIFSPGDSSGNGNLSDAHSGLFSLGDDTATTELPRGPGKAGKSFRGK